MADEVTEEELEHAIEQHFGSLSAPEAPATAEEALAHFGVKGMRWGVRKDDSTGGSSSGKPEKRKVTNTDIKSARARQRSTQRQINNQIDKTNLAVGKNQDRQAKTLHEMTMANLRNPDRATALRLTTGEKLAAGLLAVALPGPGTAVSAINVGTRVAVRRSVEKDLQRRRVKMS